MLVIDAVVTSESRALTRIGGVASILATLLLLAGLAGLTVASPGLGLRNWLVVIFQINSGLGGLPAGPLRVFNPVDIVALILIGVTFLGFWPGPGRAHKFWMAFAVALPFLGIAVLLLTHLAGRSGVMGGGTVLAILMLGSRRFKQLGYLGLVANLLLLAGDFATGTTRAPLVAGIVGVGYVLLVAWLFLIGQRLISRQDSELA